MERAKTLSLYLFYGLLAYMPLHIFLSTWLGTSFDILNFAKAFKDIVLVIGFGLAMIASSRQPWFKLLAKDRLLLAIDGYVVITLLLALIKPTDTDAEILAVVYNLRFLLFFIYGALLVKLFPDKKIKTAAIKTTLGVAAIVLTFGIIQYTVLSNSALTHVGYSRANGVLPAFFIDDKPDLERIMSTLRDPNSLGSYIIIILSFSLTYFLAVKHKNIKQIAGGLVLLCVLCLWFTFSRSAWIGALLAVGVIVLMRYKNKIWENRKITLLVAGSILLGILALFPLRNTYFVKNVIFHADESTVLEDPNQLRIRFWQESLEDAANNPLGDGPGTAGLASIRNDVQGTVLNENYYLQILHEVGVIGLILFTTIIIIVVIRLYRQGGGNLEAVALLAAFIGLAFTNFLVHIWSNEAVAYTWWGLAGLVLYKSQTRDTRRARVR